MRQEEEEDEEEEEEEEAGEERQEFEEVEEESARARGPAVDQTPPAAARERLLRLALTGARDSMESREGMGLFKEGAVISEHGDNSMNESSKKRDIHSSSSTSSF